MIELELNNDEKLMIEMDQEALDIDSRDLLKLLKNIFTQKKVLHITSEGKTIRNVIKYVKLSGVKQTVMEKGIMPEQLHNK